MKKIIGSLLMSTVVMGFGMQASAADEDVKIDKNTNFIDSKATIKVEAGKEESTKPENPDTPSGETGQNGPLSIDNVIVFNFQNMNLSGTTQHISLKNDGTESNARRNVQVTDTRGTGKGWNLQIKQSELTAGSDTLKGAYISLKNGIVVAGKDNTAANDAKTGYPTLNTEAIDGIKTTNLSTNKDQFVKLMTAEEGQGLGTYKIYYNQDESNMIKSKADDIQLVVPSGSKIGDYKGTVTWALSDSPKGNPAS